MDTFQPALTSDENEMITWPLHAKILSPPVLKCSLSSASVAGVTRRTFDTRLFDVSTMPRLL